MAWRLIDTQTLWVHNFVDKDGFLTRPAPMESPKKDLFIGTNFVKNPSLSTKLWGNEILDLFLSILINFN